MGSLYVLVAWSGVVLHEFLPEGEKAVVQVDRHAGQPEWLKPPSLRRYNHIYVVDNNVVTGLTQRRVARWLPTQGVEVTGRVLFAGVPKGVMGFLHQDYIVERGKLVPRPEAIPSGLIDRYLIVLTGLPASGKSFLRRIFEGLSAEGVPETREAFSCWKWSDAFIAEMESRMGPVRFDDPDALIAQAYRFWEEVERENRLAVAERFLSMRGVRESAARFLVVEGIKNLESARYVSRCLGRPLVLVAVRKEERERLAEAARRGHPDDKRDAERLELLRRMGTMDLIAAADFLVDTSGCRILYDDGRKRCRIRLTHKFLDGLADVLLWILCLSESDRPRMRAAISRAIRRIAEAGGYRPELEEVHRAS